MCRIDLNTHVLFLLRFVEDSVSDALVDTPSREALLVEADGALLTLQSLLKRKRGEWFVSFMLLGLDDISFQRIAARQPADLAEAVRDGLEGVAALREIFQQKRLKGAGNAPPENA